MNINYSFYIWFRLASLINKISQRESKKKKSADEDNLTTKLSAKVHIILFKT